MRPVPVGFFCPGCGVSWANPEAANPPDFTGLYNQDEPRMCDACAIHTSSVSLPSTH